MRLAILGSRGIPAKYGAFEVAAEKLGLGLVERGWQVTVYCPNNQSYRESSYQGIDLRFMPQPPGGAGTLVFDGLCLNDASKGDFDVILMLGYGPSPFLRIPRARGIPTVVNTDGLEWKRSKWSAPVKAYFRYAERTVTRLADQLISDAHGIARYYRETYGVDSHYIAYGTEIPELKTGGVEEFGVQPKQYHVVVMRMEPENSIREIVQGYLASRTPKQLLIVGPSTAFFDSGVKPLLAGQDRVRYLGPIYDRAKVFALRQNAFTYIHGHTVGGTNPSLLEAMASANFIVARDVEFNREVVGDLGRYFTTADDLARLVDELDTVDPGSMEEAGMAARRIIQARFQWPRIVDEYAAVIERVVQRHQRVRAVS